MIVIIDNERELTNEELLTVISTFSFQNRVLHFQQGDESKLTDFNNNLVNLQNDYSNGVNSLIENL